MGFRRGSLRVKSFDPPRNLGNLGRILTGGGEVGASHGGDGGGKGEQTSHGGEDEGPGIVGQIEG